MIKDKKITINDIQALKNHKHAFATLTAYDYISATIIEQLPIPLVLVGDSASMVIYGYSNTIPISMDELLLVTKAVSRGLTNTMLVGDMPFMSYQPSKTIAIQNAGRLIKEGNCDAVKLEGGREFIKIISSIVDTGIPVMGHIGLKPQKILQDSGYKIAGKTEQSAIEIVKDAVALERAGVFSVVLEGIPAELAALITEKITIPTIGIGAGSMCDGQIQVFHDLLGLYSHFKPKHAKQYIDGEKIIYDAIKLYCSEVQGGSFPSQNNAYNIDKKMINKIKQSVENL